MNFKGPILISFCLHFIMIISMLIVPMFTRQLLPQNRVFTVDLVGDGKPINYKPPKPKKAEKPPEKTEEVEPPEPEPEVKKEKKSELSIPKATPKPTKELRPKPTKKSAPKAEPTKKPEPKKSPAKKKSTGSEFGSSDSESPTGSTTGTKGSVSVDMGQGGVEFPFAYYTKQIQDLIYFNWNNPFIDIKRGEKITATVKFIIQSDGRVENPEISTTSGNDIYDLAAIRAVKESSPYPPLPLPYLINSNVLAVYMDFTYSPQ
jgi:periplasmic protein TonB